jgi:hypothetical protein
MNLPTGSLGEDFSVIGWPHTTHGGRLATSAAQRACASTTFAALPRQSEQRRLQLTRAAHSPGRSPSRRRTSPPQLAQGGWTKSNGTIERSLRRSG